MDINILFDSLGVQVQVQNETKDRLTTWTDALISAGYTVNYSDYTKPLAGQLGDNKVLVITTRQRKGSTIPPGTSFAYGSDDLDGIQTWIKDAGGSLLLFVNHSTSPPFTEQKIYWPIYDIQLAAALGITTVFAVIGLTITYPSPPTIPLPGKAIAMTPNPDAPPAIIDGVTAVEAWDSGGIVPVMSNGSGIILVPLPADSTDASGLGYETSALAFAVLYTLGKGKIIVIGHSGITGNYGTPTPSYGQIESGDNLKFLMNCVAYLAGGAS